MLTFKKLKAAHARAERQALKWFLEYEEALKTYCVHKPEGLVELKVAYSKDYDADRSVANAVEADNVTVYTTGEDEFGCYSMAFTRRAIARLRKIEQQMQLWNNRYYYLDCALDEWDDWRGLREDTLQELAALGISIS